MAWKCPLSSGVMAVGVSEINIAGLRKRTNSYGRIDKTDIIGPIPHTEVTKAVTFLPSTNLFLIV